MNSIVFKGRIAERLKRMMVLTVVLVLTFTLLMVVTAQFFMGRDALRSQLRTLADSVGRNSSAALVFNDVDQAGLVLESLGAQPSVVAGVLLAEDGTALASWTPDGSSPTTAMTAATRE